VTACVAADAIDTDTIVPLKNEFLLVRLTIKNKVKNIVSLIKITYGYLYFLHRLVHLRGVIFPAEFYLNSKLFDFPDLKQQLESYGRSTVSQFPLKFDLEFDYVLLQAFY